MVQLTIEQKEEKARVDEERWTGENSHVVVICLIDARHRHRYATRSPTVSHRVVANASVLDRELNA